MNPFEETDWRDKVATAKNDPLKNDKREDLYQARKLLNKRLKQKKSNHDGKRPRLENDGSILNRLSTGMKQSPLYLFVKYVAGFSGITNLELLFDCAELAKELTTVTMMSINHTLLAAMSDSGRTLDMCCKRHGIFKYDWREIIIDCDHRLYEGFAKMTAYYLRLSLENKPLATTSMRHTFTTLLQTRREELIFESLIRETKSYTY